MDPRGRVSKILKLHVLPFLGQSFGDGKWKLGDFRRLQMADMVTRARPHWTTLAADMSNREMLGKS